MKKISLLFVVLFLVSCSMSNETSELNTPSTQTNEQSSEMTEVEQKNLEIVEKFYEEYFNGKDLSAADRYIGDIYIQHNPNGQDGREALNNGFGVYLQQTPSFKIDIKRSASQGDLVWIHTHSTSDDNVLGDACMDIFRLDNFKIVEHWDVCQPVPENPRNDNTMF